MTTESSAKCVFFLFKQGDSVVSVSLTPTSLSNISEFEWEISIFAVSLKFSSVVRVLVVSLSDGKSIKDVMVSFLMGGVVNEERLGVSTFFAGSALEMHCQVGKMNETICSVSDYSVMSHKV